MSVPSTAVLSSTTIAGLPRRPAPSHLLPRLPARPPGRPAAPPSHRVEEPVLFGLHRVAERDQVHVGLLGSWQRQARLQVHPGENVLQLSEQGSGTGVQRDLTGEQEGRRAGAELMRAKRWTMRDGTSLFVTPHQPRARKRNNHVHPYNIREILRHRLHLFPRTSSPSGVMRGGCRVKHPVCALNRAGMMMAG